MTLSSTIALEIATDSGVSSKTAHLLRRRLEEVLEEAVDGVLSEFDIDNQLMHAVRVDEIEVSDEVEAAL